MAWWIVTRLQGCRAAAEQVRSVARRSAVSNQIIDDLVALPAPRTLVVEGDFMVRGGIQTVVEGSYP